VGLPITPEDFAALSADERLELVEAFWDNFTNEDDLPPLTEAQKRELDRRLAAHEASPGDAIPWEEVKARLLAKARQ
jgi:putative addiction module component (TIGR02574 family)